MSFEKRNASLFTHNFEKYSKKGSRPKRIIKLSDDLKQLPKILMKEMYLNDFDELIRYKFLVSVKPLGDPCLLVSQEGKEYLISSTGKLLTIINSNLPKDQNQHPNTIIECYLTNNYLILVDLLKWNGEDIKEKPIKQRLEILQEKIKLLSSRSIQIIMQEYYRCDLNSLETCYSSHKYYIKDGILFHREDKTYKFGYSSHKLLWKDSNCAVINDLNDYFYVKPNGYLSTYDNIQVFKIIDQNLLSRISCQVVKADVLEIDNYSVKNIANIEIVKREASSWSSVVFNWKLRNDKVKFDDFYSVLRESTSMSLEVPDYFSFDESNLPIEYNDFDSHLLPSESNMNIIYDEFESRAVFSESNYTTELDFDFEDYN